MSKLAKKPITLSEGVAMEKKGSQLLFKGGKGELFLNIPSGIKVETDGGVIKIEGKDNRILGLFTSLIKNAIQGVGEGYRKELELVGVGYKAEVIEDTLKFALGFSHPVEYQIPEGVKIRVEGTTKVVVEGIDKQKVGQAAAEIRKLRPPEPYKGKGIRYFGEVVRRKPGKAAKVAAGVGRA